MNYSSFLCDYAEVKRHTSTLSLSEAIRVALRFSAKSISWKSFLYASNWVSIHVHCYTMLAKHIH